MENPLYKYKLNVYDLVWFVWVLWHINHYRVFFYAKASIYWIYRIWFGCVLWYINHCTLFKVKSSLYIYLIYMIWFGWVLWHINHCRLFNAKSSLSSSSSSSCRAISADLHDPLSSPASIVPLPATSCIGTELLYIGSIWSSCLSSFMWWGPQEYVNYRFALTSPAVSRMSGSSNLDTFCDG